MRVGFRVDATARIGAGHAMRCLTLADALRARGAETLFVVAAMPAALEARIAAAGHGIAKIAAPEGLNRAGEDWHEPPLDAAAQARDSATTLAALGAPAQWMVVDHYLLDERWHSSARRGAERILVIDDLANRRLDCDLLLDETLGRPVEDYVPLVPRDATLLAGAFYALLRPEFALARPAALKRRRGASPAQRILVSLGMTDIDGATALVVESLHRQKRDWTIDVVMSEHTESLTAVQALAKVNNAICIHINSNRMAELMRDADFSIGAGGTSAWERCCLGLPSATMVLAANQALVADSLSRVGAAINLPSARAAGQAVARVIDDHDRLSAMSAAAFAVTDGGGADRIADHILAIEPMHQARSNA